MSFYRLPGSMGLLSDIGRSFGLARSGRLVPNERLSDKRAALFVDGGVKPMTDVSDSSWMS
jgi:hypothetical protein